MSPSNSRDTIVAGAPTAVPSHVGFFGRLLLRTEIDRAVAFTILARAWSLAVAPVTLLLIATYLTPELQGYYYTFGSLLALQSFTELGFSLVITQFASHEWVHLRLDRARHIVGEPDSLSRLVSLGRLACKWYSVASAVFILGVGTVGYVFFAHGPQTGVGWQSPWLILVLLSGLRLWTLPFVSLLEGCDQVANVQRFRLTQAVIGTMVFWSALALGAGLWVAPVYVGVSLLVSLSLVLQHYRSFLRPFLSPPMTAAMSWRSEIWPMQWRLAMSGLANYFAFSLFNPVMFVYYGAVVAGQMGITWQAATALQAVALAWIHARVPHFGMLIARRDYVELDRVWLRTSLVSLAVVMGGASVLWLLVYGLNALDVPLAQRLLKPLPTALLLLGVVLMQVSQCQSAYLRAHKREPIMFMSVSSSLAIGFLVWLLGSRFGPTGATAAYLAVLALIQVPWETAIWFRCRAAWHPAPESVA